MGIWVAFILCTVAVLGGGCIVLFSRHPLVMALAFLLVLIGIAGFFLILEAPFLAFLQLLIYAGGVLVLVLFVAWMVGVQRYTSFFSGRELLSFILVLFQTGLLIFLFYRFGSNSSPSQWFPEATTRAFAEELFSKFIYPFELTSLFFLLVALSAVYFVRRGQS